MDTNTANQLLRAQITAFAALVNALKVTDSIDMAALLERLNGYAELMEKDQPIAAQVLRAQAATLTGDLAAAVTANILH